MKVFGIAGWSGSGKTTLLVRLIPALVARGIEVATIKHTHHDPAFGDDEMRRWAASGAVETVAVSETRFAIVHDLAGQPESDLDQLAGRIGPVDLLLVEGFKFSGHSKIEVFDSGLGKPPLAIDDPNVVALACDHPIEASGRPRFARGDCESIAEFILTSCGLSPR